MTVGLTALTAFRICLVPEITQFGHNLNTRANPLGLLRHGPAEAHNGLTEFHSRVARNRVNHGPRMLLIAGGLGSATPPEIVRASNALVCYAASTRLFRRVTGSGPSSAAIIFIDSCSLPPVPRDILPETVGPHL